MTSPWPTFVWRRRAWRGCRPTRRRWSAAGRPTTSRDVSGEQLALIRARCGGVHREPARQSGSITLPDGSAVPKLPSRTGWMWDGEFCGSIGLRWQPGTDALPSHVLGHIGFAVVPWKRGHGYAARALALMLPRGPGRGPRARGDHDRARQLRLAAHDREERRAARGRVRQSDLWPGAQTAVCDRSPRTSPTARIEQP